MKVIRRVLSISLITVFSISVCQKLHAEVPEKISFQGQLLDSSGNPVTENKAITFKIYDEEDAKTAVKTIVKKKVTFEKNGLYNVELDISGVNLKQELWLGIRIGSDDEMTPRIKILPTASSLYSMESGSVKWGNISDVPAGFADGTDNVGAGEANLSVQNGDIDISTPTAAIDFSAANFSVTEGPVGESNIEITTAPFALSAGSVAWASITGIPAGFADNTDDVGGAGGSELAVQLNDVNVSSPTSSMDFSDSNFKITENPAGESNIEITTAPYALSAGSVTWANIDGIPAGFADGTDDVGSGESELAVQLNDVNISSPTAVIDFSDSNFKVTESPSGESNIEITTAPYALNSLQLAGTSAGEFMQRDGSVAMTGDLDAGNNDITNLGQVTLSTVATTAEGIVFSSNTEIAGDMEMPSGSIMLGSLKGGEGTVIASREQIAGYWGTEANPRWVISRDIAGMPGMAGIALGDGVNTSTDTTIWRQLKGVIRTNAREISSSRDDNVLKFVGGTSNGTAGSIEAWGQDTGGNSGRLRILVPGGTNTAGFDIMRAGDWVELVEISTMGTISANVGDIELDAGTLYFGTSGNMSVTASGTDSLSISTNTSVAGRLTVGDVLVAKYNTAAGNNGGVTVPDGTVVFKLTAGSESGAYALTGPAGSAGQILMVRNDSGQATTGLATASGGGAVFIHDGSSWLMVAQTN
ncbi:MAG: hypothetical protein JXJ19_05690 [Elusimicrobia bacterium]|nr:hypothetical protein [Elusimicrobiota bacterium]